MVTELRSLAIVGGLKRLGFDITLAALNSGHFTNGVLCVIREYQDPLKPQDLENIQKIEQKGGKVIRLDVSKDRSETVNALKGINAVVSFQFADGESQDEVKAFIDDCVTAGVKRFVPNVFGVDYFVNNLPWLRPRAEIHAHLESSAIEYTEIVNGFFADVTNLSHPSILGINWETMTAKYHGPIADAPISFTFRKDVADLVILALKNPNVSRNKVLRVQGDRKSVNEIIGLYERVSGLTFEKVGVTEDLEKEVKEGDLLPDDFDWGNPETVGPFAKMALRGTGVVDPNGEGVDNGLFLEWVPQSMERHAELIWEWVQTVRK
ncbi:UNVERIFIED_CONTAM: hypothetical protein HDU68_010959 [Siphonaria sp. JEL0065]|nr:hypothetical protein HDU68_010959 [Siphonaria sp. JEL0065]